MIKNIELKKIVFSVNSSQILFDFLSGDVIRGGNVNFSFKLTYIQAGNVTQAQFKTFESSPLYIWSRDIKSFLDSYEEKILDVNNADIWSIPNYQ